MSVKTYLQDQIRLISLSSYDLFDDEEYELYLQIIDRKNRLDRLDEDDKENPEWQRFLKEKNELKEQLERMVRRYADVPRTVRLKSVIYYPKNADYPFPKGVTYKNLKTNKKIAEFCCEVSRSMGLQNLDRTLDLIVVTWKNTEILRQIVMNGINIPILHPDDTVENRHYHFFTASAGQIGL